MARRPKYQLIASLLYLINFYFRRIDRKTDLFDDLERPSTPVDEEAQRVAEAVYDQVLDTMLVGIQDNFDLNQALDMVTL